MFKAEFFDPQQWAQLFKDSGAQYVVLTAKHHEGWCNWCSPEAFGWNSCDNGPHRDLVGEMTDAVRAQGLHMGLYHSIFEWYHPLYLQDKANGMQTSRYVDEVYLPQAKELNTRYSPDLIWSDGDWDANSSYWKSPEFLAWLYNDAPNRENVIVNDRWGNDNPKIGSGKHFGGYFSGGDRQQATPAMLKHKWENAYAQSREHSLLTTDQFWIRVLLCLTAGQAYHSPEQVHD
jgi:alpha-L-fucosidase